MIKNSRSSIFELMKQQGAIELLSATLSFLLSQDISKDFIQGAVRELCSRKKQRQGRGEFQKLLRAYEDMGTIMSTWYSEPKFLDEAGLPLPLTVRRGSQSIRNLIRISRVRITETYASKLMKKSPSVKLDSRGNFLAQKRVFVLPDFEIPRAALVVQRYLATLQKNTRAHKKGAMLLLERNCHVPAVDLKRIKPLLRDIKSRGSAFMDSIDGEIEAHRRQLAKQTTVGELGVLVFAWTQSSRKTISKLEP